MVGNVLRKTIPFVRKSLLPSAVIGGLIIFAFKFIPAVNKFIDTKFMEGLAYHCLALGFISIALKTDSKPFGRYGNSDKTGAIVVSTYLVQGVVGLVVTILLSLVMSNVLPASAYCSLRFRPGTGQALNFGSVYEGYGFAGGKSFGLTIATVGFLVACIGGVIYLNILKRKNAFWTRKAANLPKR